MNIDEDDMPTRQAELLELFRTAGYDPEREVLQLDRLIDAERLLADAAHDPRQAVISVLRAQRLEARAKALGAQSARASEELGKLLEGLLGPAPILCRLEGLRPENGSPARALCHMNGQLRELPIHPSVEIEDLERLQPWQYVCVHPQETVVIGTSEDPLLFERAQGELVELRGWHDKEHGLVRVQRTGHEESIAALAPALRDRHAGDRLPPRARLVLLRGDDRWVIATLPAESIESRFEVPIDQITTRLEDLAGMEEIVDRVVEDVLLCFVHPDLREQFDLRPLRGMLLYSFNPGMGKTALARGLALWLAELGDELGFDVALFVVKPNELKSVWHGGDARLVREELCGSIAARLAAPRSRPLFVLTVLDEIDSLGKRSGGEGGPALSGAHDDAVQSLLAEMDGMVQQATEPGRPIAQVLWIGLTNRPDALDEALKRPGRFGDLVLEMPRVTLEVAESILAIYARRSGLPWFLDGEVVAGLASDVVRERILRPAAGEVFDEVVLRYWTDSTEPTEVTAGDVMAGVHYMEGMNSAKKRAARRSFEGSGVPAVRYEDVVSGLIEQACAAARQMEADRQMLARQLCVRSRIAKVEAVASDTLLEHRYRSLGSL